AIEEAVGVGYGQGQQIRWQGFSRQASSAHRRFTRDYLTLIDAPTPGFRTPADLLRGSGQHLPDRNFSFRLILQVMQQRGRKRSQAEFIRSQGARQGMFLQPGDQISPPDDDARLWA